MPYDIYGQPLRRGYCEVHPDMHQEYPCYICLYNAREYQENSEERDHYEQEMYEQYCKDMISEIIVDSFTTA